MHWDNELENDEIVLKFAIILFLWILYTVMAVYNLQNGDLKLWGLLRIDLIAA